MEILRERDTLDNQLRRISRLYNFIYDKQNEVKIHYPELDKSDARIAFFDFLAEGLTMYRIGERLSLQIVEEGWWQQDIKDFDEWQTEKKHSFIQHKLNHFTEWLKLGFFLRSFMEFEMLISLLAKNYDGDSLYVFSRILRTTQNLLESTNVDSNFLKIWKVFAYSRNTIHFGGIQGNNNEVIEFEGKSFSFIASQPITFLTPDNLIFIIEQNIEMVKNIIISNQIKTIS